VCIIMHSGGRGGEDAPRTRAWSVKVGAWKPYFKSSHVLLLHAKNGCVLSRSAEMQSGRQQ